MTGFAVIILAAGKGTRMKSNLPKVMHPIAGRPMIAQVVATAGSLKPEHLAVVIAGGMDSVKDAVTAERKDAIFVLQSEQKGTGHAVRMAEQALKSYKGAIVILYGDTPLITAATLKRLTDALAATKSAVAVLGLPCAPDSAYGRLVLNEKGELEKIVEFKDASPKEKAITLGNSGVMAIAPGLLFPLLSQVKNTNAQGEYYLTDIVGIARAEGHTACAVEADPAELIGINSRIELAEAERAMQDRLRRRAMENGATLLDPTTVYFNHDTELGKDVVIHPHVVFGPKVKIGDQVTIRSFCHFEGAGVADNAVIGPFARLRPGTIIHEEAHIGNFVEIKASVVERGAKINHLSYVGDSFVGSYANIGAGTITCNYDGFYKYRTEIGAHSFVGSNTSLIAPVTIGEGAIVGAGSTISEDVEPGSLSLTRPTQVHKKDWAQAFRTKMSTKQ